MIIVSQDKDKIVNFKNLIEIYIAKDGIYETSDDEEIYYYLRIESVCGSYEELGKYKTEERAKEVLQEIAQKYSSYLKLEGGPAILQGQMDIQPNIFNIPKVFEMPED